MNNILETLSGNVVQRYKQDNVIFDNTERYNSNKDYDIFLLRNNNKIRYLEIPLNTSHVTLCSNNKLINTNMD